MGMGWDGICHLGFGVWSLEFRLGLGLGSESCMMLSAAAVAVTEHRVYLLKRKLNNLIRDSYLSFTALPQYTTCMLCLVLLSLSFQDDDIPLSRRIHFIPICKPQVLSDKSHTQGIYNHNGPMGKQFHATLHPLPPIRRAEEERSKNLLTIKFILIKILRIRL